MQKKDRARLIARAAFFLTPFVIIVSFMSFHACEKQFARTYAENKTDRMIKPMPYVPSSIVVVHLLIVLPCVIMGAYLLLSKKGTRGHRSIGMVYMAMMFVTGVLTIFIPADVGPRLFGHFGFLHLLSLLTVTTVPRAWLAARAGNIKGHRSAMWQLYVGGILVAGGFAIFAEGRFLNTWLLK